MKHFIITRFNLKLDSWKKAKDGSEVLTQHWLEDRWQLFENYCLPSVKIQNNDKFDWLVYFDLDTPEDYKNKILTIAKDFPPLKPQFIDGMDSLLPAISQYISSQIDDSDDFIITTRLDNDDVIHEDFVDTIQSLAKKEHEFVIDLRKGYLMNINSNWNEQQLIMYYFNPFISVVEETRNFKTVMFRKHLEWDNATSKTVYADKPLWIQLVHGKNKFNNINIDFPFVRSLEGNFGFTVTKKDYPLLLFALKNLYLSYLRKRHQFKLIVKKILKK